MVDSFGGAMHPVPTYTTATQYALGACFLVIGPAFGLAAGYLERQRGRPPALAALASTFAAWAGWFVACGVAIVLFPRYPISGPSEPVAMLFVLPGLASGLVAVRAVAERNAPTQGTRRGTQRRLAALVAAALLASFALAAGHRQLTLWPARRALPAGAMVLSEEAIEDGFLPDFSYAIEARMTEAEFAEWVDAMELVPTASDPATYTRDMGRDCECAASWTDGVGRFSSGCS